MLKARAYGKINLLLDITGREQNGYHTVNNIMQTVSVFDTVSLDVNYNGISVICGNIPEADNICLKAALEYQKAAGVKINAKIEIEKNIPIAGGMAGGSSDAAEVLVLLNRVYGCLPEKELYKIAESLGADVPFFIKGGTVLCSHYGEIIEPINDIPEMYFVIVSSGEKKSTAEMYKTLDSVEKPSHGNLSAMLGAIKMGDRDKIISNMFNSFEDIWQTERVEEIKGILKETGAERTMISGSGPSLFGVYKDESIAKAAQNALKSRGIESSLCKSQKAQGID